MDTEWRHQLRVYLADLARADREVLALRLLLDILEAHRATLVSRFDA